MKELWIRKDEAWLYYDSKPVCDTLVLDKPVDACVVSMTDEEYEEYQSFLEEASKWQNLFHSRCAKKHV